MMRRYDVAWVLTVEAPSPRAAARKVARFLAGPDATPADNVYVVSDADTGGRIEVDLGQNPTQRPPIA